MKFLAKKNYFPSNSTKTDQKNDAERKVVRQLDKNDLAETGITSHSPETRKWGLSPENQICQLNKTWKPDAGTTLQLGLEVGGLWELCWMKFLAFLAEIVDFNLNKVLTQIPDGNRE